MTPLGLGISASVAVLLVAVVLLEGRRQARIYGRGSGRSATATGLLELQRHLEPERKVEILLEETLLEERRDVDSTRQSEGPSPHVDPDR